MPAYLRRTFAKRTSAEPSRYCEVIATVKGGINRHVLLTQRLKLKDFRFRQR